jgi:hypothetical protein
VCIIRFGGKLINGFTPGIKIGALAASSGKMVSA